MQQATREIMIAVIAGTIMFVLLGLFIFSFVFLYRKKQLDHLSEKKLIMAQFQEELLRTQLEIQEQTLKNISQEVHDNIGQTLSLAKLNLNTFDIEKKEKAIDKVNSSNQLIGKAIDDLRNLSKSLNTDLILSAGLMKAIETELEMVAHAGIFETKLNISGQPIHIDGKKELILFRIVQEAINNVIKHSKATTVLIQANFMGDRLTIKIYDNGKGFETKPATDGAGLKNMTNRAQLIGGSFEIQSGSNGTTLTVTLPIKDV